MNTKISAKTIDAALAKGNYKNAIFQLLNSYGIGANLFLNPKSDYQISLEEAGDELEAADNLNPEDVEVKDIDDDIEIERNTEFDIEEGPGISDPESGINIMEIISVYNNNYIKAIEKFVHKNKGIIDQTGAYSGKDNKVYIEFIEPALELINTVYKDSEEAKVLNRLNDLLKDRSKMSSIVGEPKAPFIYEGLQLLMILLTQSYLALIPTTLFHNTTLRGSIDENELVVVDKLIDIANDIIDNSRLFGTKITFVEPVLSEIDGKNHDIVGTPYAKSEVIGQLRVDDDSMILASESISNLLSIKNNNALPEFTLIMKGLSIVAGLIQKQATQEINEKLLTIIRDLINTSKLDAATEIEKDVNEMNDEYIIPQIKRFNEMVEEDKSLKLKDEDAVTVTDLEVETSDSQDLDESETLPEDNLGSGTEIPDTSETPEEEEF